MYEMARIIEMILPDFPNLSGLWQVYNERINKFELLRLAQKYGWKSEIVPDSTYVCERSLNSERFRSKTGYVPPSWDRMIEEMANDRKMRKKEF